MGQPEKKMTALSWSDLPEDLLYSIGKRLETRIDILNFRAVCHSWQSSISLPPKSPPMPLRLQFLIKDPATRLGSFLISQTTIYRLEPALETLKSSPNKAWLIKVQEPNDGGIGKMRALDPFSTLPINNLPDSFPRVLNLLNFHVSEISRAFKLQKTKNADADVEVDEAGFYKVELSSRFESSKAVLTIKGGDLCSLKVGHEQVWNTIHNNVAYRDIVNYQGNFYAVNRFGITLVLDDSSLKTVHFVLPPIIFNGDWYFIKSCGDLFLVGRDLNICADKVYYDKDIDAFVNENNDFDIPVVFKVYTLKDGDHPFYRWREVNNLGDRAFFVSYDCSFSVLARDFAGCKANCIYFVDEIEYVFNDDDDNGDGVDDDGDGVDKGELKGHNGDYDGDGDGDGDGDDDDELMGLDDDMVCVFNLEDGSSGPLTSYPGCSNIFWPPPAWLRSSC